MHDDFSYLRYGERRFIARSSARSLSRPIARSTASSVARPLAKSPPFQLKPAHYLLIGLVMWLLVLVGNVSASTQPRSFTGTLQSTSLDIGTSEIGLLHRQGEEDFKLGYQAYLKHEYSLARRYWRPQARLGHVRSQFYMGVSYDTDLSREPDLDRAVGWYAMAANNGHIVAQHNLALAYARGDGVNQDLGKAMNWWRKAAMQGNADSQYNLGVIYAVGNEQIKQDLSAAEQWWLMAAKNGDAVAQYNLGALYVNGEQGIVTNYCKALHWWTQAGANGFSQANRALASLQSSSAITRCK